MATLLTKPITREIVLKAVGRPDIVMVTLAREGIQFRRKFTRTTYTLPYSLALFRAAQLRADEVLAARAAKRNG